MLLQRSQTSCGNHTGAHQQRKGPAAQAEAEHGLERRRDHEQREHDVGGARQTEAEREHRRGSREDEADRLREALRRTGHRPRGHVQPRHDPPRDELPERAQASGR